jgi:hypothetical protein
MEIRVDGGGIVSDKNIARRDFLKSTVGGFGSFFFLSANEKNRGKRSRRRSRPGRSSSPAPLEKPGSNFRRLTWES